MNERRYHEMVATFFGAGDLPFCPGTWGSLGGFFLFVALTRWPVLQVMVLLCALFAGRVSAARVAAHMRESDPPRVVIDEVAGIFMALVFLPFDPLVMALGFVIFRAFDIFKVPPAKTLERIPNGWGIMLDDLLCGFYTNVLLQIALFSQLF